jgi:RimJ/RimL family protein N-acetyltransferase
VTAPSQPPVLHTERLVLRPPRLADFAHFAAFYASERSRWEDGPLSREQAWRVWASDVALWPLKGFGPFGVDDRVSGAYLGEVGIYQPEGYPEPELGWFVVPEAEGRGIAFEAARAVMRWAKGERGYQRLVNYIDPGNERSIALALRLGGRRIEARGSTATDVVILHDLRGW